MSFGDHLKQWRTRRHRSQLDLSLSAEVSQRHLSWLETGKSTPSRDMIVRLADVLEVPLRERNEWLGSAGFAPLYGERSVDEAQMAPVRMALDVLLSHHDPYPAFVLDRCWRMQQANQSALKIISMFGDEDQLWERVDPTGHRSLARLTFHPDGMRPYIKNLDAVAVHFMQRWMHDIRLSGSDDEHIEMKAVRALIGDLEWQAAESQMLVPVIPLELETPFATLRMTSIISTFGTAQDITVDELRIEQFFPADDDTRNALVAFG
ncbi:MAG: helix-turn-helix domain-containing protein [Woeseiaceae bacterium]